MGGHVLVYFMAGSCDFLETPLTETLTLWEQLNALWLAPPSPRRLVHNNLVITKMTHNAKNVGTCLDNVVKLGICLQPGCV